MSASFSSRIFGAALGSPFVALAASDLFDHQTNPPSPARTTAAISKRATFMTYSYLPALPPHAHARQNDRERDHHDAAVEQHGRLARIHVQPAIFGILRPDRNQILVRAQPVEHIHVEVAIFIERQESVADPAGRAD